MKQVALTLTFGDVAENHVGMQKVGEMCEDGFSLEDISLARTQFEARGYPCSVIPLHEEMLPSEDISIENQAWVLLVKNGVEAFGVNTNELYDEHAYLDVDKKAKMYGRIVDKHARYNLCYSDYNQEPDYSKGKGRVVSFGELPLLSIIRNELPNVLGEKARNLNTELNTYYDVSKCGIGFHGDAERKRVVAIRLGVGFPLHYQYYLNGEPFGKRFEFNLGHGDLYVMSEKATGFDWKRKRFLTLRHAAGCDKFLKVNEIREKVVFGGGTAGRGVLKRLLTKGKSII